MLRIGPCFYTHDSLTHEFESSLKKTHTYTHTQTHTQTHMGRKRWFGGAGVEIGNYMR